MGLLALKLCLRRCLTQLKETVRDVYRFTPRCTQAIECTWWDSAGATAYDSHYPPKNGSSAVGWRVGSGWSVNPVCGTGGSGDACGKVWLSETPVSTAGAWIVVEKTK